MVNLRFGSGQVNLLRGPRFKLNVEEKIEIDWLNSIAFPLTPALSLGRGRILRRIFRIPATGFAQNASENRRRGDGASFSPREKAGMRGNKITDGPRRNYFTR